jgi:hypothetical protein
MRPLTHLYESFMLMEMSKRLQVILDAAELREVQKAARRERITTAEWVRRALRAARRAQPLTDSTRKLHVVRLAARHEFPAPDIEQMLDEIAQGCTEPDR